MKMTQHPKSLTSQGLKKSLVVALSGILLPAIVQAEKVSSNKPIEEVMVTGSLVTRDEFDSATPIAQYTGQELLESNATSVDEFLSKTPEFTGNLGSSTNNGNNGAKMVNLRGLGFKRTLVLINGKRTVGSFIGGAGDVGAVDLNQIPMHMVKRIDVFKDGASTIYGSDAIAGVINIILKNDFDGFEIAGGMGAGIHDWKGWDGKNSDVAITYGNSNETSSFVIGVEYSKQKELYQADRSWGEAALWPIYNIDSKSFKLNELGSVNSRRIIKGDGSYAIVDSLTGQVREFEAVKDSYNYAPVNALITPSERFQATALGNKELFYFAPLGTVSFNSEFMYTKRTSHQRLAPDASFDDITDINGKDNAFVPKNNPHNPTGEDVVINRRFVESGGRLYEQTVDTYRFSMGLTGHLDNALNWNLNYVIADDTILNQTQNLHRFDRWEKIVDPDLCKADPACAAAVTDSAMNPFDDYGSISKNELDYLLAGPLKDKYNTRMQSLTFNINGSVAAWAEDILWALGYEKRRDKAEITPDEFSANGLTTSGSIDALSGKMSVDEFYGELSVPIISGAPMIQNLIWDISARHSNYDTSAGSTTTWSTKLDWIVNNSIKSRIGFATGFRAPNLVELNTQSVNFPLTENYCELMALRDDLSPTARENCTKLMTELANRQGKDVDTYVNYYQYGGPSQSVQIQDAASLGKKLKAEKSKTFSFGLVFTPESYENISASIDYYNIKVDDFISFPDVNAMSMACISSENFDNPLCQKFLPFSVKQGEAPDKATGISGYRGQVQNSLVPYENLGKVRSSGIDFAVNYIFDLNVGITRGFRTSLVGSYLIEYKEDFGLYGKTDYTGKATTDNVYPDLKMNIGFGVFGDNWSVDWRFRYISEAKDFLRPASATDDAIAEAVFYTDLYASYNFEETYFISMGIDNLLDQAPPQYHSGFTMRTAPGVYDSLGRQIWMKAAIKF